MKVESNKLFNDSIVPKYPLVGFWPRFINYLFTKLQENNSKT